MPIALSSIQALLQPGIRKLPGEYKQIPTQWKEIFQTGKSKMAVERSVSLAFLPLAALKQEGAATEFDNAAGQRYIYNQQHLEIALGYSITRKSIDDNLYKQQFKPSNLGLNTSFSQTKEVIGTNILNTGNVYDATIGGDGVSLINPSHPIDNGTVANQPSTDMDLNESSLLNALIQIRQFKDNRGLKILARGRKLVVPIQLEYVASRLIDTQLRPGTANNDVNALLATGGLPQKYVVLDYLTSSFAWFVLTDKDGLNYLERVPYETSMWVDDVTDNLLVKGYERYSFGYDDWRSIWGTYPLS